MSVAPEQGASERTFLMRKKPRPYGTGAIVQLKNGLAIRWWETVADSDGVVRREMCYENLGDITKKEAEGRLAEKQQAVRRGPRLAIEIPTFKELCDRYKRDILSMQKFSTRSGRTTLLDTHLIPRFGPLRISELRPAEIQRFFTELRESGYTTAGKREQYSAHTLHDVRGVLRSVMKSAREWYRQPVDPQTGIPFDPVDGVRLPPLKPKHKKWALTPEQAGQLIGKLKGKAKVMASLAITCGLRRGELLALRLRDLSVSVDASGNRLGAIDVAQASYLNHIDTPKTEAGVRTVPVHPWVLDLIQDWIIRARKRKPDDLIFGTRTNLPENSNNILRRSIYPACEELHLEHTSWLTFRRTFQTFAHNAGVPARTIADMVGHADVSTQFLYIQSEDAQKRVAMERVGNKLCEIVRNEEQEAVVIN